MRIPGRRAAIRAGRWARSRWSARALILGYHRVASVESDPFDLAIPPDRFRQHLEVIQRRARPMPLAELASALASGTVPDRAVAITLDDGYTDSLLQAKPALASFGIPATVFVIAGALGREMWWDELARRSAAGQADALRVEHDRLHDMPPDQRERALASVRSRREGSTAGPAAAVLDREGVARLADGGLVDIGAHGYTHARLAELDENEQRREILDARHVLRDILGREVELFSYPHGSHSPTSRAILATSGFRCACASQPDVVRTGSDPFALPRFWVSHLEPIGLERLLNRWLAWL